jgi:hypothetical protein
MEVQPSPRKDEGIQVPKDSNPLPIVIRKLDRLETTRTSFSNGN